MLDQGERLALHLPLLQNADPVDLRVIEVLVLGPNQLRHIVSIAQALPAVVIRCVNQIFNRGGNFDLLNAYWLLNIVLIVLTSFKGIRFFL